MESLGVVLLVVIEVVGIGWLETECMGQDRGHVSTADDLLGTVLPNPATECNLQVNVGAKGLTFGNRAWFELEVHADIDLGTKRCRE